MPPPRNPAASAESADPTRPQGSAGARASARVKSKTEATDLKRGGPTEIVIVGCGGAAQGTYQPALRALERAGEVVLRAAIDPNETARAQFLEGFTRAEAQASLESVTLAPDALVILTSPTRFHSAHATTAFKRGWHVLCHSPLALSAREAGQISAAAQRHERLLAVAQHRRFYPALRYLRTLCRDHLLGPALNFEIHEGRPTSWPALPPASFPAKFDAPEGVLAELGVHTLDVLTWCLGTASVVNYWDDAMGGAEANAFLELTFPDNVRGTVHLSRDWPTSESYVFVFERGVVRWKPDDANHLTVQLANAPASLQATLAETVTATHPHMAAIPLASREQSFLAQLQNVVAAIGGQKPLSVPSTAAMQPIALIEECYARRSVISQPWFTHNEAVHARALAVPPELRRT